MTGSTRTLWGNSIFSFPERKKLSLKVTFGTEMEWGLDGNEKGGIRTVIRALGERSKITVSA